VIIWLNGPFGAGKTTTAQELDHLLPDARIFDPELLGYMLGHVPKLPAVDDFQHWPPWRRGVVATATHLLDYLGGVLICPQTVLSEAYWNEFCDGFAAAGVDVRHVVLHAERETLVDRIERDEVEVGARQWRLDHLDRYDAALPWLREAADVIDTTWAPAPDVAARIAAEVPTKRARTGSIGRYLWS
jgi:hypothetical protein